MSIYSFFTRSFFYALRILLFWIPPVRKRITNHLNAEQTPILPQNVPDEAPGIGLSKEEYQSVKQSWSLVNANLKQNGVDILMALFTAYPDYKNFFRQFKGMETEQIRDTPMLRAHATAFMHGMCAFVDNLADTETLVTLIHDNVDRHIPRNIKFVHYKNVLGLVPGFLKEKLGPNLDESATRGWNKIIDTMVNVIQKKYETIESQ